MITQTGTLATSWETVIDFSRTDKPVGSTWKVEVEITEELPQGYRSEWWLSWTPNGKADWVHEDRTPRQPWLYTIIYDRPNELNSWDEWYTRVTNLANWELVKVRPTTENANIPYLKTWTKSYEDIGVALANIWDIKQSMLQVDHNWWVLLNWRTRASLPIKQQIRASSVGIWTTLPDARDRVLMSASSTKPVASSSWQTKIVRSNLPSITLSYSWTTANNNRGHTHTVPPISWNTAYEFDSWNVPQLPGGSNYWMYRMDSWANDYAIGRATNTGVNSVNLQHRHTFVVPSNTTNGENQTHTHTYSWNTENINGWVTQQDFIPNYIAFNTFIYLWY